MKGLFKYILFIALCMVAAFISERFSTAMSVGEVFAGLVASIALYRTCQPKE